uniref:C2H2-type domain-containing protein n=1 Tax=Scophthalmus maximus TaxID=52904 RepID=A0A8D3CX14_SCOMX
MFAFALFYLLPPIPHKSLFPRVRWFKILRRHNADSGQGSCRPQPLCACRGQQISASRGLSSATSVAWELAPQRRVRKGDIKMSAPLLLGAFVQERLTAAAEEILEVFQRTIEKYEEEASSSKQEIERLRGLLQEFSSRGEETPREQRHCEPEAEASLGDDQRDPEPRIIKEEDQEFWARQQDAEPGGELNDASDLYLPQPAARQTRGKEDTKPLLQPRTHNGEREEQTQASRETRTVQCILPFPSSPPSQTQIQNDGIPDGRERERPAASSMSRTEQTQRSIVPTRESTELSRLTSVAPGCHCYLCDKSFSSNYHLINHAFRMHAKDAGCLCAVCGKRLDSHDGLDVHLKSHKASKCCHVCGKHCNSTTALAEHMTSHTGVKLHRCHVCGKECSRKGDLKIHMRIHTGEKPFCCSFCCKSFTHSGHLRKHMRSHTGERPHRCSVCGKGYLQSAHLKYHLGTHTQKY